MRVRRAADERPPTRLRGAARVPQALARVRLHGLQAREPRAPLQAPHAGGRMRRATATTWTSSRSIRTSSSELFNTLLINVTSFFRDEPAWQALREEVLPALLERRDDEEPLRVWSAGCASGQEAYSVAMTLAEILGPEAYRERVKIYGTDIDEEALAYARAAVYTAKELEGVPRSCERQYFERSEHALRLPQRPAPHGDLRPQQPAAGRADLAPGPAAVPQHADVLHRRDAGADPAALPLRARRRRSADAREVGDDALAPGRVRAAGPQAADLPQGRQAAVAAVAASPLGATATTWAAAVRGRAPQPRRGARDRRPHRS